MTTAAKGFSIAVLLAAGALTQVGCRACHTPYDYCGPVVDGECHGCIGGCGDGCGDGCSDGCGGCSTCGTGGGFYERSGSILGHGPIAHPVIESTDSVPLEAPPQPQQPVIIETPPADNGSGTR